ncbi:MAG: DNA repair protein RecN [Lachnospiraceae bacterium]
MLLSLHVKNLALIDEAEVEFEEGLNILTGETGAGKSIVVGSMNLALGEKISKEMVRDEEQPALVELVFRVDTPEQEAQLAKLDIVPEDGQIILSRKISGGRSVARINSETVTVSILKAVASIFIDIYGQHEHQTLLNRKKHRMLLDEYAKEPLKEAKEKMKEVFREYQEFRMQKENLGLDQEQRKKELDLLSFEVSEIQAANLKPGEDEELEKLFRLMNGAKKAARAVSVCQELVSGDGESASFLISRAAREFAPVSDLNEESSGLFEQMKELEDLMSQLGRGLSRYLEGLNFSEEEFSEVTQRLDVINRLKDKYGHSIEEIWETLQKKLERKQQLENYDSYVAQLNQKMEQSTQKVQKQCEILSGIRQQYARELTQKVTQALVDLNFLDVSFSMKFDKTKEPTENGWDDPQFMISVNPGEPEKPVEAVASGGELSRIMLAMKSVLAENDRIGTLIFDEIDTGISGRTAQMVAEKMNRIGSFAQVISITHLPQIAAMADTHFMVEKQVKGQNTVSCVRKLSEEESCEELARMLGGVTITQAVLDNAKEMRLLAKKAKSTLEKG